MYKQKNYIERTAFVAIGIVLVASSILSYAYDVYYQQKNVKDMAYFKRNGLSKEEFKKLVGLDCGYQILMNILFVIPLSAPIAYVGQWKLNMSHFGFISWQSGFMAVGVVFFAILQTIISRMHYYYKIKH